MALSQITPSILSPPTPPLACITRAKTHGILPLVPSCHCAILKRNGSLCDVPFCYLSFCGVLHNSRRAVHLTHGNDCVITQSHVSEGYVMENGLGENVKMSLRCWWCMSLWMHSTHQWPIASRYIFTIVWHKWMDFWLWVGLCPQPSYLCAAHNNHIVLLLYL